MFDLIVVVKNGEHCISETLRSISSQTDSLCDIYFVDGGSLDKTVKFAKEFYLKFLLEESDSGIYDAMNKGINAIPNSKKRYTLFLNCGDFLIDSSIMKYLEIQILKNDFPDIVYSDIVTISKNLEKKNRLKNHDLLAKGMSLCHQSVLIRNDVLKKKRFDISYKYASDYDMILGLYLDKMKFFKSKKPMALYSDGGVSSSHPVEVYIEMFKIAVDKLSFLDLILYSPYHLRNILIGFYSLIKIHLKKNSTL